MERYNAAFTNLAKGMRPEDQSYMANLIEA